MTQFDLKLDAPLSVSELTRRIKDALEGGFPDVWLQGEITGFRVPSSGHMYFSLKDPGAQVRAVFFRMSNRFLRFRPGDGIEVIVRGRVSVYDQRGEYQIIVEYMEPRGLGALQLAFLQLREKLEGEGLFDPARKRPLTAYPRSVGVATSPTGAAIRDILNVLGRRAPGIRVVVAPCSVQGESAPSEIARAIAELNGLGGLDAIIVGRGGGSMEDLAAFNTEQVARAIYASEIPVISAVGHEVDFTISDFVADMRAPTPSVAAEVVARSEDETREQLTALASRLVYLAGQTLKRARASVESETRALKDPARLLQGLSQRLDDQSSRLSLAHRRALRAASERLGLAGRSLLLMTPARRLTGHGERVAAGSRRLSEAMRRLIEAKHAGLAIAAARLEGLAPLAPLARGFSMTYRMPGMEIVRDPAQVDEGGQVRVRLRDGGIDCRVEKRLGRDAFKG